jgi:hypothetical protein
MGARSLRLAVLLLSLVSAGMLMGCTHAAPSQAVSPTCDPARIQQLEQQGYAWLGQNQWYKAHLAGHALSTIGDSCNQPDIAVPAGINGAYLLADVFHAIRDDRQSAYWVQRGLRLLAAAQQHEAESPALMTVYDAMQPRFLTLQAQLQTR